MQTKDWIFLAVLAVIIYYLLRIERKVAAITQATPTPIPSAGIVEPVDYSSTFLTALNS